MQRQAGPSVSDGSRALEAFMGSLRDLRVEAHLLESEAQATEVIRGIVSKAGASIVVAGIPPRYEGIVRSALAGSPSTTFVGELEGKSRTEVLAALSSADVGITWAVNGLASEGALLEIVYDDSFKLASSLPKVHLALLESSSILPGLAEAMPMVGDVIAKAPADKKPIISFISGPSKTGDIEMRLLYGVHGPHTVHALILDWR